MSRTDQLAQGIGAGIFIGGFLGIVGLLTTGLQLYFTSMPATSPRWLAEITLLLALPGGFFVGAFWGALVGLFLALAGQVPEMNRRATFRLVGIVALVIVLVNVAFGLTAG